MKRYLTLFAALIVAACSGAKQAEAEKLEISSPEGTLSMSFLLQDGVPMYTLSHKGEAVVLPSRLGFELRGTIKA